MPEYLGNVEIPEVSPSGTFPLVPDWGFQQELEPEIATHQFGSANQKIEQRYTLGIGQTILRIGMRSLDEADREALRDFWEARQGPYQPFTYSHPEPDGSGTIDFTVYFADPSITFEFLTDWLCTCGLALAVIPDPEEAPEYTSASTSTRFPSASLESAMLGQAQVLIPLVKIEPRTPEYPAIYISDRRVTVDEQLYQPRLLEIPSIGQALNGESDECRLRLGNADRVIRDLAADTNLRNARVTVSFLHVGTLIKLDMWTGRVTSFTADEGEEAVISCSDAFYELTLSDPGRTISRNCWKTFDDGVHCPYTAEGSGSFTTCPKTWDACQARGMDDYFGGILASPQSVTIKDNSTGLWGISRKIITPTSQINDSIDGAPLPAIYTDTDMEVPCLIVAGRDESDFYSALGIVGEGPIGDFVTPQYAIGADGLRHYRGPSLDGLPHHGFGTAQPTYGLRRNRGHDPAQNNDPSANSNQFSVDDTGGNYLNLGRRAAGVAYTQIRKSDPKGLQVSRADAHEMKEWILAGLGGWFWEDADTRTWANSITNPAWIAINRLFVKKGLQNASKAEQEAVFDVDAAMLAGSICSQVVDSLVGAGTETQFRFCGRIADPKPLRDRITEILANCLGYWVMSSGKLKIGIRYNASTIEAWTAGNIVLDTLRYESLEPAFNRFKTTFLDSAWEWKQNSGVYQDEAHAIWRGGTSTPEWTDGSLALSGTHSLSQAMRIAAVRCREELGGIEEAEWRNHYRISFRTTILGLTTEPGQVDSVTHVELPGTPLKMRVQRWKLNPDWSIDIEGTTVTDSMYDLAVGDAPADVVPDDVPGEHSYSYIPGNVSIVSASVTDEDLVSHVDVVYSPPGTDETDYQPFAGVVPRTQYPASSGPVQNGELRDYDGDIAGSGAARYGTCRVTIERPTAGGDRTYRIYLSARSSWYVKKLDGETPYTDVVIPETELPGLLPEPDQITDAGDITITTLLRNRGHAESFAESQQLWDSMQISYPDTLENCDGVRVWKYVGEDPPVDPDDWEPTTMSAQFPYPVEWYEPVPSAGVTVQYALVFYNRDHHTLTPADISAVAKEHVYAPWADVAADAVTDAVVTVPTPYSINYLGQVYFLPEFDCTGVDDINCWIIAVSIHLADASGNLKPGADWIPWTREPNTTALIHAQVPPSDGWPIYPLTDPYRFYKFRVRCISQKDVETDQTTAFSGNQYYLFDPGDPGNTLRADKANPAYLGTGLGKDSSGRLIAAAPAQQLLNGDFETNDGSGKPKDWIFVGDGSVALDSSVKRYGSYSARVNGGASQNSYVYQYLSVIPNRTYRLSYSARCSSAGSTDGRVQIQIRDGNQSGTVVLSDYDTIARDNAWHDGAMVFTAPSNGISLQVIAAWLVSGDTSGQHWIDRVVLEELQAAGTGNTIGSDGSVASWVREVLYNPSFSADLDGWEYSAGKVTVDTSVYYSGGKSAKIAADGTNYNYVRQSLTVRPGSAIQWLVYIRSSLNASAPYAGIGWYDSAGSFISQVTVNNTANDSTWRLVTVEGIAPANAARAEVTVVVPPGASTGNCWVDQVTFTHVDPVSSAGTAPAGVSVTVSSASDGAFGEKRYVWSVAVTPETQTAQRMTFRIYSSTDNWTSKQHCADIPVSASGWKMQEATVRPASSTTLRVRVFAVSKDGVEGSYSEASGTISAHTANTLLLSQYYTGEFQKPFGFGPSRPTLPNSLWPAGAMFYDTALGQTLKVNAAGNDWERGVTGASVQGSIAADVAYLGVVNTSQVNAGLFNGHSLDLTANGVRTRITNAAWSDPASGVAYAGLSVVLAAETTSGAISTPYWFWHQKTGVVVDYIGMIPIPGYASTVYYVGAFYAGRHNGNGTAFLFGPYRDSGGTWHEAGLFLEDHNGTDTVSLTADGKLTLPSGGSIWVGGVQVYP